MQRQNGVKKMRLGQQARDTRNGFLFALPWILGFLGLSVYPLVSSLFYSFTEFNPVTDPVWVGLDNFRKIFSDPLVAKSLRNTLFMAFVSTPINLVAALGLAMICTKRFRGRGAVRTIFFLPSVIPMVAATMIWIWMFDPTYGVINNFLGLLGMKGPSWLMDPNYTKWSLVLMGTWVTGTTMLVMMSALQEISTSYYEAARIDGANSWYQFVHVTLPGIAHVVVYQVILNFINAFQYFQQAYIVISASSGNAVGLASGGPSNSILMYPLYIFHNAFVYLDMGKASAMAWLLFLVVSLLTFVMTKVTHKVTENSGVE